MKLWFNCHMLLGCILLCSTLSNARKGHSNEPVKMTSLVLVQTSTKDSLQQLIAVAELMKKKRSDSLEIVSEQIIALSKEFPEYQAKGYSLLAYFNRTKYDYKTSAKHYGIAAELYQSIGDTKQRFAALLEYGKAHHFAKNYIKALEIYRNYNREATKAGDSAHMADSFFSIGITLGRMDSLEAKLVAYQKALVLYDRLNNEKSKARLSNNIARVYSDLKEYESAFDYFGKYVEVMRKYPESEIELSYGLSNQGSVLIKLGGFEEAKALLNESLEIKRRLGVMPTLARTLNIMGDLHIQTEEYFKALGFLEEALEIGESLNDIDLIYSSKTKLGKVHLKLGNLSTSESYLLFALESVDKSSANNEDVLLVKLLSELYQKKGEHQKAFRFYQQATMLNDSIQNIERLSSINKLKTEYEVKEKELEIESLKAQQFFQEAEINRKERERLIFLTTTLLGVAVLFFLYRAFILRKKKNLQLQKARLELEEKNALLKQNEQELIKSNKEKEVLLKEVHHRVKNNLQIINSLLSIQARQSNKIGDIDEFLHNSQSRLQSIALIHETLYASESLAKVDMDLYLERLSDYIMTLSTLEVHKIKVIKSFGKHSLDIQRVVPIGLIFSELMMNALKHAFPDNSGQLELSFVKKEDTYLLKVTDNGSGFDENDKKSLGLELVQLLTEQLQGKITFKNYKGTQTTLEFPIVQDPL
ncbi:MAG: tetratricopeptide repeat protein [Bacteroidota bacterium]